MIWLELFKSSLRGWLNEWWIIQQHFSTVDWEHFGKNIKVSKVGKYRIYNSDQTGLLYNQLSGRTFVEIKNAEKARVYKQMESKERITVMVCIAADGSKVPLLIIGKSKKQPV